MSKLLNKILIRRKIFLDCICLLGVAAAIALYSSYSQHSSGKNYFAGQIEAIRNSNDQVKAENNRPMSEALSQASQDSYQEALLEGYSACKQIETYETDERSKQYEASISQLKQFCRDYENVTDYALKVSKALEPFLLYETGSSQDLETILEYAKSDLERLGSHPLKDPALEEMAAGLNSIQKTKPKDEDQLAEEISKQKNHFITARTYYWNNTIRIDAMNRSINRLHNQFVNP